MGIYFNNENETLNKEFAFLFFLDKTISCDKQKNDKKIHCFLVSNCSYCPKLVTYINVDEVFIHLHCVDC